MQSLLSLVFFISIFINPFSGIRISPSQSTPPVDTPPVQRVPGYLDLVAVYEDNQQVVAYVSTNDNLLVFDLIEPTRPLHVQTLTLPGIINDIEIVDRYAYVSSGGLRIFDLTDPVRPTEISVWDEDGVGQITVNENYVYVSDYMTFRILDVSDLTAPTLLGVFNPQYGEKTYDAWQQSQPNETWQEFRIYDLTIEDDLAYLAGEEGVQILDISDPTAIKQVGLYGTPQTAAHVFLKSRARYSWDKKLYVVTERSQAGLHHDTGFTIHVIDVGRPALPTQIATYNPTTRVFDAALVDDLLYLVDAALGLRITDMSDPYELVEIGTYAPAGTTFNVAIQGDYAYLVGEQGLEIVDISDPAQPEKLGHYQTLGIAKEVAATKEYAYVATGRDGLAVVELAEGARSEVKTFYELPGYTLDIAIQDNFAYVATELAGLHILDLTDSTQPVKVGVYDPVGEVRQVWINKDLAFLVGDGALDIVDVSDPANPVRASRYTPSGWVNGVKFYGEYVYVVIQGSGLRILDLADSAQPQEIGVYQPDSDTTSITDVIIISDGTIRYGYIYLRQCSNLFCMPLMHLVDMSNLTQPVKIELPISQNEVPWPTLSSKDEAIAYLNGEYLSWLDVQNPITSTMTQVKVDESLHHYLLTDNVFLTPNEQEGLLISYPDWPKTLSIPPQQRKKKVFNQLILIHQITTSVGSTSTSINKFDFPISSLSPQEIVDLISVRQYEALDQIWQELNLEPIPFGHYVGAEKFDILSSLIGGPHVVVEIGQYDYSSYLFFRRDDNEWQLMSYIPEIYSRFSETEYRFVTYDEDTWLVINRHSGSGTGYGLFEENWYLLTENGFEYKLRYPVSGYESWRDLWRGFGSNITNSNNQDHLSIDIEIQCEFSHGGIDLFTMDQRGRFVWDAVAQEFFADPDQSQIHLLEPYEEICSIHYEKFLENYSSELMYIAREGNDGQMKWLEQYLMQTGLDTRGDNVIKLLLDSLQKFD